MVNPYYRSLFLQLPVVLGVQLKPLSCYHIAALELTESPYMITGGEPNIDDLVAAVFICSRFVCCKSHFLEHCCGEGSGYNSVSPAVLAGMFRAQCCVNSAKVYGYIRKTLPDMPDGFNNACVPVGHH